MLLFYYNFVRYEKAKLSSAITLVTFISVIIQVTAMSYDSIYDHFFLVFVNQRNIQLYRYRYYIFVWMLHGIRRIRSQTCSVVEKVR